MPSTTANSQETARAQISSINWLMSNLQESLPEQAELLRQRVLQIEADARFAPSPSVPPSEKVAPRVGETSREYFERRIGAMEDKAAKESNPLTRNILYAEAALATFVDRYERAWNLARNIKDDDALRDAVTNVLAYRAALHFLGKGELEKASEINAKSKDLAQRAAFLVVGAQKLFESKDPIRAGEWLQEARTFIRKTEPDENSTRIMLGAASTFARFDHQLALSSLDEAVKLMDKFPLSPNKDERAPFIKRFAGLTFLDFTYGTSGFGLHAFVQNVEAEQFESVLYALNKIKNPVARGFAVVLLCDKYLKEAQAIQVKKK